jgi:hypothetical protein
MRLTNQQRIDAIIFFNKNKFHGIKYKYFVVTAALKDINIHISAAGLRNLINKYKNTGLIGNKKRTSHSQRLISNRGLLSLNEHLHKNAQYTSSKFKDELVLTASTRSITRYCNKLGWKKIRTRYCQLVSPNNRIKRFIYACCAKIFNENYHDSIHADECTVELRRTTIKTWYKSNMPSRAAGGKVGKPKHNTKVHLWGGISRRGLTDLVIFEGKMNSAGFQDILTVGLIPFLENFPEGHLFFQDGDPKHTSNETKNFMTIHGINNYPMPPESPDLNPVEMIWNILNIKKKFLYKLFNYY